MQIKNTRILEALQYLKEQKQRTKDLVEEIQTACKHDEVGEAEGTARYYVYETDYEKTKRVCLCCGLTEEQNPGYTTWKVLSNPLVYKLTMTQLRGLSVKTDWI